MQVLDEDASESDLAILVDTPVGSHARVYTVAEQVSDAAKGA